MKVIRYAIYAVIALLLLAVAAVAIAVAVINPNDYKPQIEAAVEKQTNLDLMLEGDIGWSFIPLGLELNQVEANLDGERFVALEQLIAQMAQLENDEAQLEHDEDADAALLSASVS